MTTTQIKTTELGQTGLNISRIGFGAWALGGGGWEFGWGPQDDQQSVAAIEHALEHGINWIDTAAAYGFGRSEEVVGRALRGIAERPYVFTKCSLLEGPGSLVDRLKQEPDLAKKADLAIRTVLSRRSRPDEVQTLVGYLQRRQDRMDAACQQVVWALVTSAEFRFNH